MKKMNKMTMFLLTMIAAMFIATNVYAGADKPVDVYIKTISSPAYNKVKLTWEPGYLATDYFIYRREVGKNWERVGSTKKTTYTHTSSSSSKIVIGRTYYYMVRSYSSVSKMWGDYDLTGMKIATKPNKPVMKALKQNTDNSVTVSWNKTSGGNYYVVYRKATGDTGWKKLKTLKSTELSYVDKDPIVGKKSYYTVRLYYSATKTYSDVATGKSITVKKKTTNTTPSVPSTDNDTYNTPIYDSTLGWIVKDAQVGYFKVGYVNYTYVRLRETASTNSKEILKLEYNDRVDVEFENNGFYKVVAYHNGLSCTGYVAKEYVTFGLPQSIPDAIVNYTFLNLRENPNESSKIHVQLSQNDKLRVRETNNNGWYYVTAEHQNMYYTGWVCGDYIKFVSE